jgi:putative transposase
VGEVDATIQTTRTAVVYVTLSGADYRLAHDASHTAALLWDRAVDWVHDEWRQGRSPGKYDIQNFLTSLPRQERPLHSHTTETISHDLHEAIETSRTNKSNGMKVRAPWRHKNYRPLSFSKGFGWRVTPKGKLALSLGRGRPRLLLEMPEIYDSATGQRVSPELWGELQLCWDRDNRRWSLHIPYGTSRPAPALDAGNVTAVDEGIINSMALATWVDDSTIDVTIINGREGRAMKRLRNKSVGSLQKKIERAKEGSKRHRKLVAAKKRAQGRAKDRLQDFDHQVSHLAAEHIISHKTGRLVYGDVRGIEQKSRQKRRSNRRHRQQLSQWSRGRQERYTNEKTNLKGDHVPEERSTKTCPKCLTHNHPNGRYYRCKNPECGFTCHRDAVGAVNILQRVVHGDYTPIGAGTQVRVTYLRAVERWAPRQRKAHSDVQRRKARALSSAQNRASAESHLPSELAEAKSSSSSKELGQLAAVA